MENFLKWKADFDADMSKLRKKKTVAKSNKLTGRQLFMRDASLNDSDVKFLEAAGETVKVDESLFEDLDDLDLDDDEEDPDWNPNDDVSD